MTHDQTIEQEAAAGGVDPDLIRAIMYAENARGQWKDNLAKRLGLTPTSALPMNINASLWSRLLGHDSDLTDPRDNVRAAARLLRRISENVKNPTPEKIASIWHFAGAEQIDEFGALVGYVLRRRPWEKEPETVKDRLWLR